MNARHHASRLLSSGVPLSLIVIALSCAWASGEGCVVGRVAAAREQQASPRKVFIAGLGTETNSFSPIPTGPDLFRQTIMVRGGKFGDNPIGFGLPPRRWSELARARGWTVVESLVTFAKPAGDTTRAAFESLRDEILSDLRRALPLEAVLLNLHGAMIADGYPDAEGDFLSRVREIVGTKVVIGAELDLHCHLTEQKVRAADALVIYKHYPHIDMVERAEELFRIVAGAVDGHVKPVMAMYDCRIVGIFPTTREPLQGFVGRMQRLEGRDGILSVSLAHGFPWGDTPEVGMRTLVVADGDAGRAAALAARLGKEIWELREGIVPPFITVEEAVDRILRHKGQRPLVLADTADNPGLGAAGDSTFLLRRLIERRVGGVAIAPFWDPLATHAALEAGVGARLKLRLGGKMGPASGDPVDAQVTVMGVARGAVQNVRGSVERLGAVAWLRIGGDEATAIEVIVNDNRNQAYTPECFTAAGLAVGSRRALIVKSTQHFHDGFQSMADEILYVAAPGTGPMDMRSIAYQRVTRPLWPRVADPFAQR